MGVHYNKADFITYGRPSLFLDFANKKSLTDRISGNNLITFTRTSTGTYVGADGSIKTASANEPRFDHNPTTLESLGLLIEEQRTNLFVNNHTYAYRFINNPVSGGWVNALGSSSDNTQFTGSNATVTTDLPGGVIGTAARATLNGSDVNASFQFDGISFSAGILSTYIRSNKSCSVGWGTEIDFQTYNLQANVWTRVSASLSSNPWGAAVRNLRANSRISNISGGYPVTFDLCFVQQEAGSFPTSYIPTSGSQVTRNADSASITGTNFSSWYNQSQGTIFTKFDGGKESNFNIYGRIVTTNNWSLESGNASNAITLGASGTFTTLSNSQEHLSSQAKCAFSYENNTAKTLTSYPNSANLSGSTGTNNAGLQLGSPYNSSNYIMLNGHINQLSYYPTRLTDTQLQNITK